MLMATREEREKRVRGGSRRRRDLAAVGLIDHADRAAVERADEEIAQRDREERLRPQVQRSDKAEAAWSVAQLALSTAVPDSTYRLWLEPLTCLGEVSGALAVEASEGIFVWVFRRYAALLGDAVRRETDYRGLFLFRGQPPTPGNDEGLF
jgi:hypothetical protein